MKKKYWRLVGRSACLAGLAVVNGGKRQGLFVLLVWLFQFFGFDHSARAQITYEPYNVLVKHAYFEANLFGKDNITIVAFGADRAELGVGQFSLTVPSSPAPPPNYTIGQTFISYCMELDVNIGVGGGGTYHWMYAQPFSVAPSPSWVPDGAGKAAYLYNRFSSGINSDIGAAALQTAIWSVLYGKYGDNPGQFDYNVHPQLSSDFYSAWQDFIRVGDTDYWLLNGQAFTSTEWKFTNQQGLLGPPIPEPAATGAAVAAVLGLISIYEVRQRRTRLARKPLRS